MKERSERLRVAKELRSDNPRVKGISFQEFREWRHHPISEFFFEYLRDFSEALADQHKLRWANGIEAERGEKWAHGQYTGVNEIADVDFKRDILEFYSSVPELIGDPDEDFEEADEEEMEG